MTAASLSPACIDTPPNGTSLFIRLRAVASHGKITSAWTSPKTVIWGTATVGAAKKAVIAGRARIAPLVSAPVYTNELIQKKSGVVTGRLSNFWDGKSWSPWVKMP